MKLVSVLLFATALIISTVGCSSFNISVRMPHVSPDTNNLYLCQKTEVKGNVFITEFHPQAEKATAHHMLLYHCDMPPYEDVWNCGEMTRGSGDAWVKAPICRGHQRIIYAWAMDAPELNLPTDVAFELDGGYLVLQVHYASVAKFHDGLTDNSGVVLTAQRESLPNLASVWFSATNGQILPGQEEHFDAACQITDNVVMYPFAYRTHAHKLGLVNAGYVVKTDVKTGEQSWIEIGRRSPQLPQMFYPISGDRHLTIRKGDVIATRCTMENYRDHMVRIGPTGEDEMCNFYIMYYVKRDESRPLRNNVCFTPGPPNWHFASFRSFSGDTLDTTRIPDDISEVPMMAEEEMKSSEMNMKNGNMKQMSNMNDDMDKFQGGLDVQEILRELELNNELGDWENENRI